MTRANHRAPARQQGGFSLIDVLLALGVVILISGITLTGIRRNTESKQAEAAGEQIKMLGNALNTYISMRYELLSSHDPGADDVGEPGTAPDPGPRTCVWVNSPANTVKMCTITSETLRRSGLTPNNFSGYNAFGSTYEYRIRVDTTGAGPAQIDGLVWTSEAYTMEGEERFDLLGQAMLAAGADSGMTRSTLTRVEGFNGAWSEENMGVSKLGVLAFRAGYKTFGYAAYLRLSGTGAGAPMTGDIDMGDNQIYNINTIKTANLAANTARFKQDTDSIIFSAPASFNTTDNTAIAARAASDPGIMADTAMGTPRLVLKSDAPIAVRSANGAAGGDMTLEDLTASGTVATNTLTASNVGNSIVAQGSIVANGRVRAQQGFLAGDATAGQSKTLVFSGTGAAGDAGGIYFNVDGSGVTGTPMGFKLDSSTATLRAVNSNILADGNIRAAGTLTSDTRVIAGGNALVLDSTITPAANAACTGADGGKLVRLSTTGMIGQCVALSTGTFVWRAMGISDIRTIQSPTSGCSNDDPGNTTGQVSDATCPAGYYLVSGGYVRTSGAERSAPTSSTRINDTVWRVIAGATTAYNDGGASLGVTTCYAATAVCAR